MKNASVLIMAGGRSERMGSPKPFLLIEGKSFIRKISEEYFKGGVKNIFSVLNHNLVQHIQKDVPGLKIIPNPHPEFGRLYSIQTGLRKMSGDHFTFIHNVDNPFVDRDIIKEMWSKRSMDSFVIPVNKGKGGHPILISGKIRDHILSVKNLSPTLKDILHYFKKIEIETDSEKILANINTWREYEEQVLDLMPEYSSDRYI